MYRHILLFFLVGVASAIAGESPVPAPLGADVPSIPFSFSYDGRPSGEFLLGWLQRHTERALDTHRREVVSYFTDPKTKLEVRCVAVRYLDFPTVEWTVYFKNNGKTDTPLIEGIQALDARWTSAGGDGFLLHHEYGVFWPHTPEDFIPQSSPLGPGASKRFVPSRGRACADVMPYFNLERGGGSGIIVVVGWPGAWAAQFVRDAKDGIRVTAGQELTHLRLHPGEEIRTPLIALQTWHGDWIEAQNTWRRWMFAHNFPRWGGQPPRPMLAANSGAQFGEMIGGNEKNQIQFIDGYRRERIPLDFWWMDAGWYVNNGRWQEPIEWKADPTRFPHGLRAVSDHAHSLGMKTIVWFEPERVMPSNVLFKEHPEWLLRNKIDKVVSRLLYLGNPEARAWLTDLVSRRITEEGIDVYRQDFNVVEPVDIWRSNDTPERQGIIENHHVSGLLAFWDELLRRHPNLIMDSCAGGGSRIDLETMRRAVPFWRSDYCLDPVSNQTQTYGLSLWVPYFGTATGADQFTSYEIRSNLACPLGILSWDVRDPKLPYADLRRAVSQWREYVDDYLGDFYPLTPCSLGADVWIAWQYDRPETGHGVIQAFRRGESVYETARVKLRGLDPAALYLLSNLDHPGVKQSVTGRELMDSGLTLAISSRPGSTIVTYEKLRDR
jgi:alpha-galactosidase